MVRNRLRCWVAVTAVVLATTAAATVGGGVAAAGVSAQTPAPAPDPLTGTGVWIWHVADAEGGAPAAITARARAAGVSTVIVKAAHGPTLWPQFSPTLIAALKAGGLRVCGYQRLLGRRPGAEAAAAVRVIRSGADCFVIDAEAELEGRYAQARAYVRALRRAAGAAYPIALTSFAYADVHQRFPYSVFLAPGAAQFNVPQIYWKLLGAPVGAAVARSYPYNRVYGRPIRPLGQLWNGPTPAQLSSFRRLTASYGARGVSWWNWDQARPAAWSGLGAPPPVAAAPAAPAYPTVRRGARGDVVRWAKVRLQRMGGAPSPGPVFDLATQRSLVATQAEAGLAPTGAFDPPTWSYLIGDIAAEDPVPADAAPAEPPTGAPPPGDPPTGATTPGPAAPPGTAPAPPASAATTATAAARARAAPTARPPAP